jgi:CubicO group peptidase (beta-lactamase class C family)
VNGGASIGTVPRVKQMTEAVDAIAERTSFPGVVRVDGPEGTFFTKAYGLADRGHEIPNRVDTQFGIASGTKGLTALTVVRLIEAGSLDLATTARSVLGTDLPLIDADVTIEQLLSHRSGIGDYLDEEEDHQATDYLMTVPVHELATTEQYLAVLDGHRSAFPPGSKFAYCNGGYVVLALIAERATGESFHELVRRLVCEPAGMGDTEFLRSDELPGRAALGYLALDDPRTNVFHLPVRGSGDGGVYSTAADFNSLWSAFFDGRIVSSDWMSEMLRPRSDGRGESLQYGLGFWLHPTGNLVELHGYDAGVSFRSQHDRSSSTTYTVVSNTSKGTWPIEGVIDEHLAAGSRPDG